MFIQKVAANKFYKYNCKYFYYQTTFLKKEAQAHCTRLKLKQNYKQCVQAKAVVMLTFLSDAQLET